LVGPGTTAGWETEGVFRCEEGGHQGKSRRGESKRLGVRHEEKSLKVEETI